MSKIQKTHFADDDTLKHIAKLEAENKELVEALRDMTDAAERLRPLTVGDCNAARALLAKHGG